MKQQYNKIYRSAVKAEMALKHINLPVHNHVIIYWLQLRNITNCVHISQ